MSIDLPLDGLTVARKCCYSSGSGTIYATSLGMFVLRNGTLRYWSSVDAKSEGTMPISPWARPGTTYEVGEMIVSIAHAAETDLADGYWFYERQHVGLVDYFRVNMAADIESLALTGGIHEVELGFHRALAKRFPYSIYYLVEGNQVIVAAVLDLRREPLGIREHLNSR